MNRYSRIVDVVKKFYEDFMIHNADSRVQNWKMMRTPGPTLFVITVYIATIFVFLPTYMKRRKPYNLTKVIKYYNLLQIAACCGIFYMMITSGWTTGEYSFACQPIDYTENPNALRLLRAFHLTYFLKMTEFLETVFFIMRKKFNQVSALHVYHHVSTFLLAYIGCRFLGGGMIAIPVMINCFIHVLMYIYYYLSALGPKWQKVLAPWKPKLTTAQMIQFLVVTIHSLTVFHPDCTVSKKFLLFFLPNIVVNFWMFYNFYRNNYYKGYKKSKNF